MAIFGNVIGASAQSVNQLIATNCLNGLAAAGQVRLLFPIFSESKD